MQAHVSTVSRPTARLLSELIGTFFLVLTISLAVQEHIASPAGTAVPPPVTVGFVLMCLVYTFGFLSQAHFNPAVSFMCYINGWMEVSEMLAYFSMQIVGGLVGAFLGWFLGAFASAKTLSSTHFHLPAPAPAGMSGLEFGRALVAEFVFTFLLVLVILHVGFVNQQKPNQYYGMAIGLIVSGGGICVGRVSGAAFNPAVASALQIVRCIAGQCDAVKTIYIFWVASIGGSTFACVIHHMLVFNPPDKRITGEGSKKSSSEEPAGVELPNTTKSSDDESKRNGNSTCESACAIECLSENTQLLSGEQQEGSSSSTTNNKDVGTYCVIQKREKAK